MKRKLLIVFCLVISSLSVPSKSFAALEGCPSNWGIKVPELTVSKFSAVSNGAKVHFYTSSLFGADNSAKGQKGIRYPLEVPSTPQYPRFQGEYSLKAILPEVYEKLTSLGKDAIWSSNYEIVRSSIPPSNKNPNETEALFVVPMRSWLLYDLGIGNGTQMRYHLKISIKSCGDYVASSNVYTFNSLEKSTMTLDDFFKYSSDPSIGAFNFKQEELIRSRLENNKKLIAQGSSNLDISLDRLGPRELDGKEFSYLFLGTNPISCIQSINPTSYPAVNPVSVIVKTSNCEISIVTGVKLTEQLNCKSSTCSIDPQYDALMRKLQFNSYGGDWQYDRVEIGTFTVSLQKVKYTTKSITCVKGKTKKKVTGAPPKCPNGFKLAS